MAAMVLKQVAALLGKRLSQQLSDDPLGLPASSVYRPQASPANAC
jgi:hypothetical protein